MSYPVLLTSQAQGDVLRERERQFYEEGWTDQHDDTHGKGELAAAACAYLATTVLTRDLIARGSIVADPAVHQSMEPPEIWPWERSWWKPKGERRDLVRAAALIIAEIERLDRAEARKAEWPTDGTCIRCGSAPRNGDGLCATYVDEARA